MLYVKKISLVVPNALQQQKMTLEQTNVGNHFIRYTYV